MVLKMIIYIYLDTCQRKSVSIFFLDHVRELLWIPRDILTQFRNMNLTNWTIMKIFLNFELSTSQKEAFHPDNQ